MEIAQTRLYETLHRRNLPCPTLTVDLRVPAPTPLVCPDLLEHCATQGLSPLPVVLWRSPPNAAGEDVACLALLFATEGVWDRWVVGTDADCDDLQPRVPAGAVVAVRPALTPATVQALFQGKDEGKVCLPEGPPPFVHQGLRQQRPVWRASGIARFPHRPSDVVRRFVTPVLGEPPITVPIEKGRLALVLVERHDARVPLGLPKRSRWDEWLREEAVALPPVSDGSVQIDLELARFDHEALDLCAKLEGAPVNEGGFLRRLTLHHVDTGRVTVWHFGAHSINDSGERHAITQRARALRLPALRYLLGDLALPELGSKTTSCDVGCRHFDQQEPVFTALHRAVNHLCQVSVETWCCEAPTFEANPAPLLARLGQPNCPSTGTVALPWAWSWTTPTGETVGHFLLLVVDLAHHTYALFDPNGGRMTVRDDRGGVHRNLFGEWFLPPFVTLGPNRFKRHIRLNRNPNYQAALEPLDRPVPDPRREPVPGCCTMVGWLVYVVAWRFGCRDLHAVADAVSWVFRLHRDEPARYQDLWCGALAWQRCLVKAAQPAPDGNVAAVHACLGLQPQPRTCDVWANADGTAACGKPLYEPYGMCAEHAKGLVAATPGSAAAAPETAAAPESAAAPPIVPRMAWV